MGGRAREGGVKRSLCVRVCVKGGGGGEWVRRGEGGLEVVW